MLHTARLLFCTPIRSRVQWAVIVIISISLIFTPQYDYNDWERNTEGLFDWLNVYENPNAVYPPWGLILLWPYYLLTAAGARVASGLAVGWLAARHSWSLGRFLAVVLNPFFIWTMLLSNVDLLALLLPIVLWEAAESKRWQGWGRSAALAMLLIKPQGGVLMIAYWLWMRRNRWHELIVPGAVVLLIVVPISLAGSPVLLVQWLDNLRNPSAENQEFWRINNVSLTEHIGAIPAILVVGGALWGLRTLMHHRGRPWTAPHTYAGLLLASLLIAPYASNQSVIVPIALVPSWAATLLHYVTIFGASALGTYRDYDPWWTLVIVLSTMWLFRPLPLGQSEGSGAVPR